MSYNDFQNEWLGKRIDFDGAYGFQCVDLIRQWLKEDKGTTNTGGVAGAIDYWRSTPAGVLAACDKVGGSDAQAGDVVVLFGINGNPYGHIGVATGQNDANNVTILEQNGATGNGSGTGGDAIRTRAIPRSRVAGLLRPKGSAPAPAPASGHTITIFGSYRTMWACNADGSVGGAVRKVYPPAEGYTYDILGQRGTYYLVYSPTARQNVYLNTDPAFVDPSLTRIS